MRALLLASVALGCLFGSARAQITVGSKAFTENRILGEMLALLIEERAGLPVRRRTNLGGTLVVWEALKAGEIDLYVEYTGTGWGAIMKRAPSADPLEVWIGVERFFREQHRIRWLPPFGFDNSYALAVRTEVAERLGLRRISDLRGKEAGLRAGFHHEFLAREDGWARLPQHYGIAIADVNGMEHGLAYEAMSSGAIDLMETYTTDGKIPRSPIRLLEDDLGFWPPYAAAPLVREEVLGKHPGLEAVIGTLGFRIDEARMQALNAAVELDGRSHAAVARAFLIDEGLLAGSSRIERTATDQSLVGYFIEQRHLVARRVREHLVLTLLAVVLCMLTAVPLGIWLARRPRLAGPVISAAGVIQTIPSLALLALMIPLPGLGLGFRSALLALFLYSVLPVLRNTYAGMREVAPSYLEAADGMGLTRWQRLRFIELPLAGRTIMAGIRTATVIGIGVATLAAFVGAGGLGDPILTGLQLNDWRSILLGAIPAAVLALGAEFALGRLERSWRARGRRSSRRRG